MKRLIVACAALVACGDSAEVTRDADTSPDVSDVADAPEDTNADGAEVAPEVVTPVSCDAPGTEVLRLVADGTVLRDADGREVRLRGVNAGGRAKFAPYLPFAFAEAGDEAAPPFSEALAAYYDRIAGWGLNVVRMPFTWEAIEPTRGTYDEVFLGRLDAMIEAARARGIRVVLDFHQDVFARIYCGDGFPPWALGDPDVEKPADCSAWFLGYFQNSDMQKDFDRFWANEDGLRDAYEALWTMLAGRYTDTDAVVGFELINEPGWGTRDVNEFTRDVLTPFYTRMIEVVRAVAPDTLVFVDPTGLDGVTGETALGKPVGDGVVFAPHFYDALALAGTGEPDLDAVATIIARWRAVGDDWDVPVLLGEFGVPHDGDSAVPFMRAQWDAIERLAIHGTQWEYSVTGDRWNAESLSVVESDGSERAVVAELVRPYPVAIAGTLGAWSFDRASGVIEVVIEDADGVTLIATPERLFPGGAELISAQGASFCTRADGGRFVVGGRGEIHVRIGPRE